MVTNANYTPSANSTCAPGLAGVYCTACQSGSSYFDPLRVGCVPCGAAAGFTISFLVIGVLLVISVIIAWHSRPKWWPKTRRFVHTLSRRLSLRARLRIAVSFVQIVTMLGSVYRIGYPVAFRSILNALTTINLDIAGWLPGLQRTRS